MCIGNTTDVWNTYSTGVFAHATSYGTATVTDGTSNTILYSEALVGNYTPTVAMRTSVGTESTPAGPNNPAAPQRLLDVRTAGPGGQTVLAPAVQAAIQQCDGLWTIALTNTAKTNWNRGWRWAVGSPGYTCFNTVVTPNKSQVQWTACRLDDNSAGSDYSDFQVASSNHPGGVNAAFCDGSVHFIKDSIAPSVYWSLGTRGCGEAISSDGY